VLEAGSRGIGTAAFTLPLPAGWTDRTAITITGPADDGFAPNIVVTSELLCDNMGLGGFSAGWLNKLGEEVPVTEDRPLEHVEIAGLRGHLRFVSWSAAGLRLKQVAALLVDGETAYAIVGTATDWSFDELESSFRTLLGGFRLSGQTGAA
jgi:hypothetical protein